MLTLVVLISGRGSNLQAIMDAIGRGDLCARIAVVISNRADAPGLDRARRGGIPTCVIPHGDFPDRDGFDHALAESIQGYDPDLIILAGFMRILGAGFVRRFDGRILNIHPALLPKFRGTDTHRRALEAGETEHGATVHVVTEALDDGPIVMQARVPVLREDDVESLASRVLSVEHGLYPAAIGKYGAELSTPETAPATGGAGSR
ncbi:MAG: phosphoribosylglycinamide formyltransferase [Gammaproteobacteria bacterium]|nr:phosphoribosylglycinamide formyltransferase [Gammaproteobacteria bacterium]MYG66291.1 phosphoribosylglycinamide formyltransferase [Gammaproteobacteria bacterium]